MSVINRSIHALWSYLDYCCFVRHYMREEIWWLLTSSTFSKRPWLLPCSRCMVIIVFPLLGLCSFCSLLPSSYPSGALYQFRFVFDYFGSDCWTFRLSRLKTLHSQMNDIHVLPQIIIFFPDFVQSLLHGCLVFFIFVYSSVVMLGCRHVYGWSKNCCGEW